MPPYCCPCLSKPLQGRVPPANRQRIVLFSSSDDSSSASSTDEQGPDDSTDRHLPVRQTRSEPGSIHSSRRASSSTHQADMQANPTGLDPLVVGLAVGLASNIAGCTLLPPRAHVDAFVPLRTPANGEAANWQRASNSTQECKLTMPTEQFRDSQIPMNKLLEALSEACSPTGHQQGQMQASQSDINTHSMPRIQSDSCLHVEKSHQGSAADNEKSEAGSSSVPGTSAASARHTASGAASEVGDLPARSLTCLRTGNIPPRSRSWAGIVQPRKVAKVEHATYELAALGPAPSVGTESAGDANSMRSGVVYDEDGTRRPFMLQSKLHKQVNWFPGLGSPTASLTPSSQPASPRVPVGMEGDFDNPLFARSASVHTMGAISSAASGEYPQYQMGGLPGAAQTNPIFGTMHVPSVKSVEIRPMQADMLVVNELWEASNLPAGSPTTDRASNNVARWLSNAPSEYDCNSSVVSDSTAAKHHGLELPEWVAQTLELQEMVMKQQQRSGGGSSSVLSPTSPVARKGLLCTNKSTGSSPAKSKSPQGVDSVGAQQQANQQAEVSNGGSQQLSAWPSQQDLEIGLAMTMAISLGQQHQSQEAINETTTDKHDARVGQGISPSQPCMGASVVVQPEASSIQLGLACVAGAMILTSTGGLDADSQWLPDDDVEDTFAEHDEATGSSQVTHHTADVYQPQPSFGSRDVEIHPSRSSRIRMLVESLKGIPAAVASQSLKDCPQEQVLPTHQEVAGAQNPVVDSSAQVADLPNQAPIEGADAAACQLQPEQAPAVPDRPSQVGEIVLVLESQADVQAAARTASTQSAKLASHRSCTLPADVPSSMVKSSSSPALSPTSSIQSDGGVINAVPADSYDDSAVMTQLIFEPAEVEVEGGVNADDDEDAASVQQEVTSTPAEVQTSQPLATADANSIHCQAESDNLESTDTTVTVGHQHDTVAEEAYGCGDDNASKMTMESTVSMEQTLEQTPPPPEGFVDSQDQLVAIHPGSSDANMSTQHISVTDVAEPATTQAAATNSHEDEGCVEGSCVEAVDTSSVQQQSSTIHQVTDSKDDSTESQETTVVFVQGTSTTLKAGGDVTTTTVLDRIHDEVVKVESGDDKHADMSHSVEVPSDVQQLEQEAGVESAIDAETLLNSAATDSETTQQEPAGLEDVAVEVHTQPAAHEDAAGQLEPAMPAGGAEGQEALNLVADSCDALDRFIAENSSNDGTSAEAQAQEDEMWAEFVEWAESNDGLQADVSNQEETAAQVETTASPTIPSQSDFNPSPPSDNMAGLESQLSGNDDERFVQREGVSKDESNGVVAQQDSSEPFSINANVIVNQEPQAEVGSQDVMLSIAYEDDDILLQLLLSDDNDAKQPQLIQDSAAQPETTECTTLPDVLHTPAAADTPFEDVEQTFIATQHMSDGVELTETHQDEAAPILEPIAREVEPDGLTVSTAEDIMQPAIPEDVTSTSLGALCQDKEAWADFWADFESGLQTDVPKDTESAAEIETGMSDEQAIEDNERSSATAAAEVLAQTSVADEDVDDANARVSQEQQEEENGGVVALSISVQADGLLQVLLLPGRMKQPQLADGSMVQAETADHTDQPDVTLSQQHVLASVATPSEGIDQPLRCTQPVFEEVEQTEAHKDAVNPQDDLNARETQPETSTTVDNGDCKAQPAMPEGAAEGQEALNLTTDSCNALDRFIAENSSNDGTSAAAQTQEDEMWGEFVEWAESNGGLQADAFKQEEPAAQIETELPSNVLEQSDSNSLPGTDITAGVDGQQQPLCHDEPGTLAEHANADNECSSPALTEVLVQQQADGQVASFDNSIANQEQQSDEHDSKDVALLNSDEENELLLQLLLSKDDTQQSQLADGLLGQAETAEHATQADVPLGQVNMPAAVLTPSRDVEQAIEEAGQLVTSTQPQHDGVEQTESCQVELHGEDEVTAKEVEPNILWNAPGQCALELAVLGDDAEGQEALDPLADCCDALDKFIAENSSSDSTSLDAPNAVDQEDETWDKLVVPWTESSSGLQADACGQELPSQSKAQGLSLAETPTRSNSAVTAGCEDSQHANDNGPVMQAEDAIVDDEGPSVTSLNELAHPQAHGQAVNDDRMQSSLQQQFEETHATAITEGLAHNTLSSDEANTNNSVAVEQQGVPQDSQVNAWQELLAWDVNDLAAELEAHPITGYDATDVALLEATVSNALQQINHTGNAVCAEEASARPDSDDDISPGNKAEQPDMLLIQQLIAAAAVDSSEDIQQSAAATQALLDGLMLSGTYQSGANPQEEMATRDALPDGLGDAADECETEPALVLTTGKLEALDILADCCDALDNFIGENSSNDGTSPEIPNEAGDKWADFIVSWADSHPRLQAAAPNQEASASQIDVGVHSDIPPPSDPNTLPPSDNAAVLDSQQQFYAYEAGMLAQDADHSNDSFSAVSSGVFSQPEPAGEAVNDDHVHTSQEQLIEHEGKDVKLSVAAADGGILQVLLSTGSVQQVQLADGPTMQLEATTEQTHVLLSQQHVAGSGETPSNVAEQAVITTQPQLNGDEQTQTHEDEPNPLDDSSVKDPESDSLDDAAYERGTHSAAHEVAAGQLEPVIPQDDAEGQEALDRLADCCDVLDKFIAENSSNDSAPSEGAEAPYEEDELWDKFVVSWAEPCCTKQATSTDDVESVTPNSTALHAQEEESHVQSRTQSDVSLAPANASTECEDLQAGCAVNREVTVDSQIENSECLQADEPADDAQTQSPVYSVGNDGEVPVDHHQNAQDDDRDVTLSLTIENGAVGLQGQLLSDSVQQVLADVFGVLSETAKLTDQVNEPATQRDAPSALEYASEVAVQPHTETEHMAPAVQPDTHADEECDEFLQLFLSPDNHAEQTADDTVAAVTAAGHMVQETELINSRPTSVEALVFTTELQAEGCLDSQIGGVFNHDDVDDDGHATETTEESNDKKLSCVEVDANSADSLTEQAAPTQASSDAWEELVAWDMDGLMAELTANQTTSDCIEPDVTESTDARLEAIVSDTVQQTGSTEALASAEELFEKQADEGGVSPDSVTEPHTVCDANSPQAAVETVKDESIVRLQEPVGLPVPEQSVPEIEAAENKPSAGLQQPVDLPVQQHAASVMSSGHIHMPESLVRDVVLGKLIASATTTTVTVQPPEAGHSYAILESGVLAEEAVPAPAEQPPTVAAPVQKQSKRKKKRTGAAQEAGASSNDAATTIALTATAGAESVEAKDSNVTPVAHTVEPAISPPTVAATPIPDTRSKTFLTSKYKGIQKGTAPPNSPGPTDEPVAEYEGLVHDDSGMTSLQSTLDRTNKSWTVGVGSDQIMAAVKQVLEDELSDDGEVSDLRKMSVDATNGGDGGAQAEDTFKSPQVQSPTTPAPTNHMTPGTSRNAGSRTLLPTESLKQTSKPAAKKAPLNAPGSTSKRGKAPKANRNAAPNQADGNQLWAWLRTRLVLVMLAVCGITCVSVAGLLAASLASINNQNPHEPYMIDVLAKLPPYPVGRTSRASREAEIPEASAGLPRPPDTGTLASHTYTPYDSQAWEPHDASAGDPAGTEQRPEVPNSGLVSEHARELHPSTPGTSLDGPWNDDAEQHGQNWATSDVRTVPVTSDDVLPEAPAATQQVVLDQAIETVHDMIELEQPTQVEVVVAPTQVQTGVTQPEMALEGPTSVPSTQQPSALVQPEVTTTVEEVTPAPAVVGIHTELDKSKYAPASYLTALPPAVKDLLSAVMGQRDFKDQNVAQDVAEVPVIVAESRTVAALDIATTVFDSVALDAAVTVTDSAVTANDVQVAHDEHAQMPAATNKCDKITAQGSSWFAALPATVKDLLSVPVTSSTAQPGEALPDTPAQAPADEAPVETPADDVSVQAPADEAPVETPADDVSVQAPAGVALVVETHAEDVSVQAPADVALVVETHADDVSVQAPADVALVVETHADDVSVQAPADVALVVETHAEDVSVQAPADVASFVETHADDVSFQAPADVASVVETHADDVSVQAPADVALVVETHADDVSVQAPDDMASAVENPDVVLPAVEDSTAERPAAVSWYTALPTTMRSLLSGVFKQNGPVAASVPAEAASTQETSPTTPAATELVSDLPQQLNNSMSPRDAAALPPGEEAEEIQATNPLDVEEVATMTQPTTALQSMIDITPWWLRAHHQPSKTKPADASHVDNKAILLKPKPAPMCGLPMPFAVRGLMCPSSLARHQVHRPGAWEVLMSSMPSQFVLCTVAGGVVVMIGCSLALMDRRGTPLVASLLAELQDEGSESTLAGLYRSVLRKLRSFVGTGASASVPAGAELQGGNLNVNDQLALNARAAMRREPRTPSKSVVREPYWLRPNRMVPWPPVSSPANKSPANALSGSAGGVHRMWLRSRVVDMWESPLEEQRSEVRRLFD